MRKLCRNHPLAPSNIPFGTTKSNKTLANLCHLNCYVRRNGWTMSAVRVWIRIVITRRSKISRQAHIQTSVMRVIWHSGGALCTVYVTLFTAAVSYDVLRTNANAAQFLKKSLAYALCIDLIKCVLSLRLKTPHSFIRSKFYSTLCASEQFQQQENISKNIEMCVGGVMCAEKNTANAASVTHHAFATAT